MEIDNPFDCDAPDRRQFVYPLQHGSSSVQAEAEETCPVLEWRVAFGKTTGQPNYRRVVLPKRHQARLDPLAGEIACQRLQD
jgi:hypothetical protein